MIARGALFTGLMFQSCGPAHLPAHAGSSPCSLNWLIPNFFLIQQFKTHRAAFSRPAAPDASEFMDFICRYLCTPVISEAIRDVHLSQLGDDGAVLIRKAAVKRAVIRTFRPQHHRARTQLQQRLPRSTDFRIRAKAVHPLERFILAALSMLLHSLRTS